MERIRLRPLALAAVLGATALVPMMGLGQDVQASGAQSMQAAYGLQKVDVFPALLPGKENTNVIAQNDGSANATIAMDVYTPAGVLVNGASVVFQNVPPGGTRVFAQAYNGGLVPGFRGVGVLSSDQPINALLVRDIESQSGQKSYSIHNAYATGGNVVTLPYLANAAYGGVYNTRVAIANTGTSVSCVTITYSFPGGGKAPYTDNGPGGSGCASGYAVPVNGQISFAPTTVDGAIAFPSQTANSIMAANVNASGSPVTVGVDAYLSTGLRKLASYDGFVVSADPAKSDVSTNLIVPIALKLEGYYSQILLSNPNATAANATITYKGTTGTYTVPLNIPANGTANHSVYDTAGGIPEGFVGAATVTSDQPISAVVFRSKMTSPGSYIDEDLYTAANAIPASRATTTVKLPLIFRHVYKTGGLYGYNTWVSVATADGSTANVTITAINDPTNSAPNCQATATYTTTKAVNGSFVFYQIADTDNGFGQNPGCFWGGMTITSDKPIIAIANATTDLAPGDNDGLYNAFGN